MKKRLKCSLLAVLLAAGLIAGGTEISAEAVTEYEIMQTVQGMKELTGSAKRLLLTDEEMFPAGTAVCDWTAQALAFAGEKEAYDTYLERLKAYVTERYEKNGALDPVEATPYQRLVLTVQALGGDPQAFGNDGKGQPVDLVADGTYAFRGESLDAQGLSGDIYALLALDSGSYEVPQDAVYTREDIIDALLAAQTAEGEFRTSGMEAGVDMTAMALQALAPYRESGQVNAAAQKAFDYIAGEMTQYGTFTVNGTECCESSAQVLLALSAWQMDAETDARFNKNGTNPWEGMKQYRQQDGTYRHTIREDTGNLMATQQALLALEAVRLQKTEGRWLWNFDGYQAPQSADEGGAVLIVIAAAAVILILATVVYKSSGRIRKHAGKDNRNL